MEAILNRRSIRRYTEQPVPDELVRELLEAAMSAPSAGNEQPWEFVVINDRQILNEIPKFHAYSQMLKEAPVAILVCGDLNQQKYDGYWVLDCAAATENILIAVQAKGLGAVWLGIYPMEDRINGMRQLLGIPEHVVPVSLVAIGYPGEQKQPANRFKQSKIRYNKW